MALRCQVLEKYLGALKTFRKKTDLHLSALVVPATRLTQLRGRCRYFYFVARSREIKFEFTISRVDIFRVGECAIRMGKIGLPSL